MQESVEHTIAILVLEIILLAVYGIVIVYYLWPF
jgi:hypothetical protein